MENDERVFRDYFQINHEEADTRIILHALQEDTIYLFIYLFICTLFIVDKQT